MKAISRASRATVPVLFLLTCIGVFAVENRPNIVFILADDLGQHQLGCYGSDFYETPHLDLLATEGVRFTNAYAAAAVCSPTRASIMTGKYPARLHITDYIPGNRYPHAPLETPDWQLSLPLEEVTIAEALREAGYVSGHFGKWHLNRDKEYAPGRPGDPRSQGFEDVLTTLKPKAREREAATANENYDAHHVDEITYRAIRFMEEHRNEPFFCYVTHNSIHAPNMAYGPTVAKYASKPNASVEQGNDPVLGAMVQDLDASVGEIVATLKRLDLAENTLLVFFGDNGMLGGEQARKPLYGDKGDLYEGGIREPLIVRLPGEIPAGSVSEAPVSSIDFFPTFLEYADLAPADGIDGQSLIPVLRGANGDYERPLYWHYPNYHSAGAGPSAAVRVGRYKLIEWFEKTIGDRQDISGYALYDLEDDPGETTNLVDAKAGIARSLRDQLHRWQRNVGAQIMRRNPKYDPAKADERN